jgi:hypothetical protein
MCSQARRAAREAVSGLRLGGLVLEPQDVEVLSKVGPAGAHRARGGAHRAKRGALARARHGSGAGLEGQARGCCSTPPAGG